MKPGAARISGAAPAVASGHQAQVPPDPRVGLHGAPPDAWPMVLEPPCITPDERAQPWEAHRWRPANNERDVESPEAATVLWD